MIEIETHLKFNYKYGAADECEAVLRSLGFSSVRVTGSRGSHGGEIWISDDERNEFEEKIVGNKIISEFRDFYIGSRMTYIGYVKPTYSVSYLSKRK